MPRAGLSARREYLSWRSQGGQTVAKYFLKRLLHGLISVVAVVAIVMVLIYSLMDRQKVFAQDPVYTKQTNNTKQTYTYQKWEEYGYLDYVTFEDYVNGLAKAGEIDDATREEASKLGRTAEKDSDVTAEYVEKFRSEYEKKGYTVRRLDVKMASPKKVANGGRQQMFAFKDHSLLHRLLTYFGSLLEVDNIHYVQEDIENRGLTFTLHDPAYGGEKFSPAILGNGTKHKYLLYFDSSFPFIHQNLLNIRLGTSYSVNYGMDVFDAMTQTQGSYVKSLVTFPTGFQEQSADDIHSATYLAGSLASSDMLAARFTDDYTNVTLTKNGLSKMGYSFSIGIIATAMAYLLGLPLGVLMSRKKDKLVDHLGTIYIVFIIAVPSLAYIFLFKAIGGAVFGLPTVFDVDNMSWKMYVLPVVSLALPQVANLMKWMRRYMIDQMNSDYVKFARSGGLSESEIFSKHIMKNAAIPIIHGVPASVLGALTGAIITERVYVVPGAGNLLTTAINAYDNGVIVGVTLFYALLSVISIILGDILMSMVDPRISFSTKDR